MRHFYLSIKYRKCSVGAVCIAFLLCLCISSALAQSPDRKDLITLLSFSSTPKAIGDPVFGNLGGQYGVWNRFPDDQTQYCKLSFVQDEIVETGYCLQLDYDVDSPYPAYNGFWLKLQGADFTSFNTLNVYLRGDEKKGYTKRIKIELKDSENTAPYVVSGITSQWKKFSIPFSKYWKIKNWADMQELVIVFDDIVSTQKTGTIYLDTISVSKE